MKKIDMKAYFEKINVDKIKQYLLIMIALILFSVGFMNYKSGESEKTKQFAVVENENADMIGDVELVSSGSVVENEETVGAIVDNNEQKNTSSATDYFESIRIERDAMYSRMLETYHKMIDNDKLAETQKAIAVQEIEKITNNENAIMISESLIKNKGFEDAVVLVNEDVINVVVKSSVLSNEDIGKIQNIIEREFKVSLENVNISNKN